MQLLVFLGSLWQRLTAGAVSLLAHLVAATLSGIQIMVSALRQLANGGPWLLVTARALMPFAYGQGMIVIALLLLALLCLREVARVSTGPRWQTLTRILTVGITPLLIIFAATVAVRFVDAFQ